jgi:hypothetical protein
MSWCRQVSGSSFVTGSWHQTEADLAPNPVGGILRFFPAQEERPVPFHASWCPRPGDMAVLSQILALVPFDGRPSRAILLDVTAV